jgi:DNA polymerase Ligase (LigD)
MPRYVILLHELPPGHERATHWDLMLECGGSLRTWALDREPSETLECDARQLADHRLAYLEHEGPVSGGRGHVTRWDEGVYQIEAESAGTVIVALRGRRLDARVRLTRTDAESHLWNVSFSAAPTRG